ncbi:Similar to Transcriptional activator hacA; acc. no. Q1XGE2 [Pyronema omphalodes CBS 100304]|uniref:Similar to Transcriptional activator hacA acc. no. Q1XGE2 n=1 Tax=Pyronema omphalodes (strain CBS 100304) TaxID=1076935 RepID=U4LTC0_PYROM|nr:Similar to Transcriptional activator hacA; acc. no. Q1XGE2 [Pyronema omphalodes CBS 100304]
MARMSTMVDDMPTTPQSMCDSNSSYESTPEPFAPATPASSMASPSPMSFDDEINIKKESGETKPPVKKRKSWGQQLPTPTTNLPPRKRAKTAEEKEQRRVERVLRNRAAAQKSREVKKQQMETIESERDQLKQTTEDLMDRIRQLEARLAQYENIGNTEPLAAPLPTFLFGQEMHLQTPNTLSTTIRVLKILLHDTTTCRVVVRPAVSAEGHDLFREMGPGAEIMDEFAWGLGYEGIANYADLPNTPDSDLGSTESPLDEFLASVDSESSLYVNESA